jgi:hypothetical protein
LLCIGKIDHGREALQKALVIRNNRSDLSLLRHDFSNHEISGTLTLVIINQ